MWPSTLRVACLSSGQCEGGTDDAIGKPHIELVKRTLETEQWAIQLLTTGGSMPESVCVVGVYFASYSAFMWMMGHHIMLSTCFIDIDITFSINEPLSKRYPCVLGSRTIGL